MSVEMVQQKPNAVQGGRPVTSSKDMIAVAVVEW